MKEKIRAIVPEKSIRKYQHIRNSLQIKKIRDFDQKRYLKYSFGLENNLNSYSQLEARITKEYHSIEKGLSYKKMRLGFGKVVLNDLISLMILYKSKGYSLKSHCYQTALSNLNQYIEVHESNNFDVSALKETVQQLGEHVTDNGGVNTFTQEEVLSKSRGDFKVFSLSRHSVRDFSDKPVEMQLIEEAIQLAQKTPSACNRQAWKTRVIEDENKKKIIQANQNGNRGFGDHIDKFIVITTDLQFYSKPRERNQANIDGGMYAMNLLYCLHYYGIAAVPLSASLLMAQESNVRDALNIANSENLIMFIGIGNYVDTFKVPKSDRRIADFTII